MIEWILSSSVLILMFVLLRCLFRKRLSMRVRYGLWLVVALRLLIPVQIFESNLSVLNVLGGLTEEQELMTLLEEKQYYKQEGENLVLLPKDIGEFWDEVERSGSIAGTIPNVEDGAQNKDLVMALGNVYAATLSEEQSVPLDSAEIITLGTEISTAPDEEQVNVNMNGVSLEEDLKNNVENFWHDVEVGMRQELAGYTRIIWVSGMFLFLGLVVIVNVSYWRRVYHSRRRYEGEGESELPVYVCVAVGMPCMFGLIHPAVYLTQDVLDEKTLCYVLCHENTHYIHRDHLWALVRLLCVCIHWFNPLVWMAAYLSRQDCELACDEETIERLGNENRISYGRALLSLSVQGREILGALRFSTTMSGRKKQLKERLQIIARQPKRHKSVLMMVLAGLSIIIVTTFTGGKDVKAVEGTVFEEPDVGNSIIIWNHQSEHRGDFDEVIIGSQDGYEDNGSGNQTGAKDESIVNQETSERYNTASISIDLNDKGIYVLQVVSKVLEESGIYEIIQVNLCQAGEGEAEVLQSICPGDVKPLYTKNLQESRQTGEDTLFHAGGESLYAKSLCSITDLPAYVINQYGAEGGNGAISPLSDGGIQVGDFNFDGYEDFCLQIGAESVNQPYYCYLWNPAKECFEHSVMIPNLSFNKEIRLIESATEDGEGQHSVKYYMFDKVNHLHMVRYVEENESPGAVFPFLDLTYHEASYALPAVDDWDAGTEYGGALNERFVYWAKEALTELYEYSGTKIDTACFSVTSFGNYIFAKTPQDLDASRSFYDRCFGEKAGFSSCIEHMNLETERTVWFSSVVQWNVPEQIKEMSDIQLAEWYFTRSALSEGEVADTIEQSFEDTYVIKTESGKYYEITLSLGSREMNSMYGPYDSYPQH